MVLFLLAALSLVAAKFQLPHSAVLGFFDGH
jgi:hypothetical protein